MKRKGFTLIELLAVIVVLAIIALISTPIIIKGIDGARKGAFKDSAYGVVDAAKIYFADKSFEGKVERETFTFPEDTKLKLTGKRPESGSVRVEEDGKIELAITNGIWCAIKKKEEEEISVIDYNFDECKITETRVPTDDACFIVEGNKITDYICEDTEVIIPSTIKGIAINTIGGQAFRNKGLTSVVIEEGITSIESYVFAENQLTDVTLPSSINSIGGYTFARNRLASINLPKK